MVKEKIVVLKLNENRDEYTRRNQIPKTMRDEYSKKIGSEFDRSKGSNSKDIIRGLNPVQEAIYMPKLLGLQKSDQTYPMKVKDFWADFSITPTAEGIKLNIATTKQKVKGEDGEEEEIDMPVNLDDYMTYQIALKSSKVASTEEQLSNLEFFDFYIEDLSSIKEREISEFEIQTKADMAYARILSKFEKEDSTNIDKVNWVLEMTKENRTFYDPEMLTIEKQMLIKKLATNKPKLFLSLIEDPQLESKALVNKAITYGILSQEGNDVFYLNENMGSIDKGALSWLNKPEKNGSVAAIKSKLEQKILEKRK